MPRSKTPSFVAECPLRTTAGDEATRATWFDAARNTDNAVLSESLGRLDLLGESRPWHAACTISKARPRSDQRRARTS